MSVAKTVIRVASEDLSNNYVELGSGISGSVVHFSLVYNQTNYNIVSSSLFRFTIGASTHDVYISPGFYSPASLGASLSTLLQIVDASFTVSVDSVTRKMSISCGSIFNIITADSDSMLLDTMGFTGTYTGQMSYTGAKVARGYYGAGMYLDINGLGFDTMISNNSSSILETPLLVPWGSYGDLIEYNPGYPIKLLLNNGSIRSLSIKFRDSYGRLIDFNGGSWVLSMIIDEKSH